MTTSLTPYRSNTALIPAEDQKPSYGLLRAPKPPPPVKPHECHPPGFWKRLGCWLIRRPIHEGSLWRCHCGQLVRLEYRNGDVSASWVMASDFYHHQWEQMGGAPIKEKTR